MTPAAVTPEFWLFLPQLRMPLATITARARQAERAGFDGIALIDHLAPPGMPQADMYDAITTAAAVIAATERLRVTHLVLCGPFRHPAVLAKEAVTLDHLSGGRFELGIGWGSVPGELARYGLRQEDAASRAARLGESLQVIRQLLSGRPVDHDGRFYRLAAAIQRPVPVNGSIPVTIGGAGPKLTMPLVREFAHWWNVPAYAAARLDELRPLAGQARISVQLPVGLVRTARERDEVAATAEKRFGGWGGLITGTAPEVAETLAGYVARGAERFFLQFSDFGTPATLDAFAATVMPLLRGGRPSAEQVSRPGSTATA